MSRTNTMNNNAYDMFLCGNCGVPVFPPGGGTAHRTHCPHCLWSRHVDVRSGDRSAVCRGMMEPAGIAVAANGEWSVIHRCVKCGYLRANRIAGDDSEAALLAIALKPLLRFPFPPDVTLAVLNESNRKGGGL